jgi:hypothetical protein
MLEDIPIKRWSIALMTKSYYYDAGSECDPRTSDKQVAECFVRGRGCITLAIVPQNHTSSTELGFLRDALIELLGQNKHGFLWIREIEFPEIDNNTSLSYAWKNDAIGSNWVSDTGLNCTDDSYAPCQKPVRLKLEAIAVVVFHWLCILTTRRYGKN